MSRAAVRLLVDHDISALPVVDADNHVLGVLSEGDLLHREEDGTLRRRSWWVEALTPSGELAFDYAKSHGRRVAEVMSDKVVSASEDTPLSEIANILEKTASSAFPSSRTASWSASSAAPISSRRSLRPRPAFNRRRRMLWRTGISGTPFSPSWPSSPGRISASATSSCRTGWCIFGASSAPPKSTRPCSPSPRQSPASGKSPDEMIASYWARAGPAAILASRPRAAAVLASPAPAGASRRQRGSKVRQLPVSLPHKQAPKSRTPKNAKALKMRVRSGFCAP